jgi:signal transduction histidine kinase
MTQAVETEVQKFSFTVDSALLRELGERLVSTVHVGLSELVKNSYDADATTVKVKIEEKEHGGPHIVVEDNGAGMSPDAVSSFWMRIGTTNKEDAPRSERFGRPRTGRKGVGRFACRRLGTVLVLETLAHVQRPGRGKETARTTITFDWTVFVPGEEVESVTCRGDIEYVAGHGPTGTRLEITGAPDNEWETRGYNYVRRQLAVIASNAGARREGFEEDPGFTVELYTPEDEHSEETQPADLRERVIAASWGTLDAHVTRDGRAHFTLSASGFAKPRTFDTRADFKEIAGAKLHLGILPSNRFEGVRDPSLLANYVLRELQDDWGGVQIRFNGFRMYPYGDAGDDWVHIEADRARRLGKSDSEELLQFASAFDHVNPTRVLLNMLSMRNYLGHVDVSSDMPGLQPRMDRQGFIANRTFEKLRQFVRMAIEWATIYREVYLHDKRRKDAEEAYQTVAPLIQAPHAELDSSSVPAVAQYLRKEIDRLTTGLTKGDRDETRDVLLKTVTAIEAISAESLRQLRHLRLVASASTLTLLFAHEVRASIASLGAGAARLKALARNAPEQRSELIAISGQLTATQGQLTGLVDMTGVVGAFRADQKPGDINLRAACERAVNCFRLVIENYSISVNLEDVKRSLLVGPLIEGEIYSVLINVLSNAVKSLIASARPDKQIRMSASARAGKVLLVVEDNGVGLDPEFFSEVFSPFISDPGGELYDRLQAHANPEDAALFGTGSGLGLAIARDILRSRKGDMRFVEPSDDWSASLEIELP